MGDAPEAAPEELAKAAEPEKPVDAAEPERPEAVKTAETEAEPDEPEEAEAEAEKPAEPERPGDPKKEWPLALGIMVAIATISWAFLTLLRAP